jgi:hypothetical protein
LLSLATSTFTSGLVTNADDIEKLLVSFSFSQLVKAPTRCAKSGKWHTLDLILTRESINFVLDASVTSRFSDHHAVQCSLNITTPQRTIKSVPFRAVNFIDLDAFVSDLDSLPLLLSPADNLDSLLLQYNDGFASVLDKHAPIRTKSFPIRLAITWFDESVRLLHREARYTERTWRSRELRASTSGDWSVVDVLYEWYCSCVDEYYSSLKVGKKHYLSDLIVECGSDQKKLFRLINDLMGKSGDPPLPDHLSKSELANDFLKFFSDKVATIGSSLDSVGKDLTPATSSDPVFLKSRSLDNRLTSFFPISPNEVKALITQSPCSSCFLDSIQTRLLREVASLLAQPISSIINLSLSSGVFPGQLKSAVITTLLKKPSLDPKLFSPYRPVSNTAFLAKLTERHVACQLSKHLSSYNILDEGQSAYRPRHSTKTALLSLFNDLLMTVDASDGSSLLFLDLSAAFDTVDNEILLERLSNNCGVTDLAANWFRSYLTGRTQVVSIKGELSESSALLTGFFQGAVWALLPTSSTPTHYLQLLDVTTFVTTMIMSVNYLMTLDATSLSAFS